MKNLFMPSTFGRFTKAVFFVLLFLSAADKSIAQTKGTLVFTLLKQPCNDDGILMVQDTTPGLTFPITFTWYVGGRNITQTSNTAYDTLINYSGTNVYVYAQSGATPGSSYASGSYVGSPPFTFTDTTTSAICPALGTAKATVTGGTPPYTIQWIGANNVVVSTANPASLPGGSYGLVITDARGCVYGTGALDSNGVTGGSGTNNYGGVYVPYVSPIKDSIVTTKANCTNGSVNVVKVSGGTPPYSYAWNNGSNDHAYTGLSAGNYQVTVTDSLGCYLVSYAYVQQSITITANTTITNDSCAQHSGSAIAFGAGGHTPYTYAWSNGQHTQSVANLTGGTYYTVTVTDSNQCTGVGYASIAVSTPVTVSYSTTPSSCTSPTGSATLTIAGGHSPYTVKWYSSPAQTGVTATNLSSGEYNFVVTDSVGCTRSGTVYIPPVSVIKGSLLKNDALCTQPTGTAQVSLYSGAAPFTYSWSNGATTQGITGLTAGFYYCTITDSLHCYVTKYVEVNATSPIIIGLNVTPATCLFRNDGLAAATVSGGTLPYTYSWSNGETSATDTVATGRYYLYVQDSSGCVQSAEVYVGYNQNNDSCYCTLTGKVYLDTNNNCSYDKGELLVPNIMIHCNNFGYTFTDGNGEYSIKVPTGSYTLSEAVQAYYPLAPCQNNSIPITITAASGCVIDSDFANVVNPVHDVQICTVKFNDPVPGFNYQQKVVVTNNGSVTEPGIQLGYKTDGQLNFSSVAPSLFTQQNAGSFPNWYSITNSFPALAPGASQAFDITYNVPADIPLGTSVLFQDTVAYAAPIANWLADYTPWNNVNAYTNIVIGSFDPNSKEVSPTGTGAPGYISTNDSVLTYTIHFQNTGTFFAQNVKVVDQLDSNLDMTTLHPIYSNFPFTASMNENGMASFVFDNINLPDSSGNQLASIGVLVYSVKQKHGLANGTQIQSPANIFFDVNAPVATNAPLNTLGSVCNGFAVSNVQTQNVTCNSDSTGAIIISPTGGAGQLLYSIDSGSSFVPYDTIKNLAAGSYQIAIKDSNNCIVYSNGAVNINQPVADTPAVNQQAGAITDTLTVAVPFISYQWYFEGKPDTINGTGPTLVATKSGVYKALVTDGNGCTTFSQEVTVKILTTGIKTLSTGTESLSLYPNPTDGNLNVVINTNEAGSPCTLKIYDLVGNVVQVRTVTLVTGENIFTADVSSLSTGLYFVEASYGQHTQVQKLNVVK